MNVLAKKLSIIERIAQTESEDLLEQIDVLLDQGATLSLEHQEIIDERLVAHQANPELGLPWAQVKKRIKRGLDS